MIDFDYFKCLPYGEHIKNKGSRDFFALCDWAVTQITDKSCIIILGKTKIFVGKYFAQEVHIENEMFKMWLGSVV